MEDIKHFDKMNWAFVKKSYPGIPLKHFVDNFIRYDKIRHDTDCPSPYHDPLFLSIVTEKTCNKV